MVFRSMDKGHVTRTWQILMREGGFKECSRQTLICAEVSRPDRARCTERAGRSPYGLNTTQGRVMRNGSQRRLRHAGPLSHVKDFGFNFWAVVS